MRGLPAVPAAGWQARLDLGFAAGPCSAAGHTRLVRAEHSGPLRVQRPFHPEADGTCHVYVLHPPGGVVGGDELVLNADLAPQARALLTTPSAAKFYRSAGAIARQTQVLRVADGAVLEWLPQETLLFEGARVSTTTRIELAGSARGIAWEIACLGRPAAGEGYGHGGFDQRIEVWRDAAPVYLERSRFEGGGEALAAAWGLGGEPVSATLIATAADTALCERAREALGPDVARLALTLCDDLLLARYRGPSASEARERFGLLWSVLRPVLLGKPAHAPRIWNT